MYVNKMCPNCEDYTLVFYVTATPGERQTWDYPGSPAEIDEVKFEKMECECPEPSSMVINGLAMEIGIEDLPEDDGDDWPETIDEPWDDPANDYVYDPLDRGR